MPYVNNPPIPFPHTPHLQYDLLGVSPGEKKKKSLRGLKAVAAKENKDSNKSVMVKFCESYMYLTK